MRLAKTDVLHAVVGSSAFWVPSVILHLLKGAEYCLLHWWVLGSVQPLTTLATLLAIRFIRPTAASWRRPAFWFLLGIWILGPIWITTNFTFDGGGFAMGSAWLDVLIATLIFPLFTPWLSLYDGSLIGLVISSLVLGVAASDLQVTLARKVRSGLF